MRLETKDLKKSTMSFRTRDSLLSLGWVFCCGLFTLLLGLLLWLALWVAGTYLVVRAVQSLRVVQQGPTISESEKKQKCDIGTVAVSGASILALWILFVGLCIHRAIATVRLIRQRQKQQRSRTSLNHKQEFAAAAGIRYSAGVYISTKLAQIYTHKVRQY